jgi:hypothetical protein
VWGTADEIKELVALMLDATAKLQKPRDERASDARELNFTMRVLPQGREPSPEPDAD